MNKLDYVALANKLHEVLKDNVGINWKLEEANNQIATLQRQ